MRCVYKVSPIGYAHRALCICRRIVQRDEMRFLLSDARGKREEENIEMETAQGINKCAMQIWLARFIEITFHAN